MTANLSKNNVAVGRSWLGYLGSTTGTALDNVTKGFGSAIITSTGGKIACTFNEDNRTTSGPNANLNGQGDTYAGVPDGKQTKTAFFPQIVSLGADSFRGGFQIQNTTGTAATCTYEFAAGTGVNPVQNVPLAANDSNSVFAESLLAQAGAAGKKYNASMKVTCTQPIVGIYNLSVLNSTIDKLDPFAENNGINQ